MEDFESLNLSKELLAALSEMGFKSPTEVQAQTIPYVFKGKDVIVKSKTGTGKTGAFLIPIIQMLRPTDRIAALVVVPTRELAMQVFNVMKKISLGSGIKGALVYGGASINVQIDHLRRRPQIVIGTPGRIIDLMEREELDLSNVKHLVLDEADMMLDMGFIDDVEFIIKKSGREKQVMLFSATIPPRISGLSDRYMHNPQFIEISHDQELTVESISHSYSISERSHKLRTLFAYIETFKPRKAIIFSDTKRNADYLYRALTRQGYSVTAIHGDMSQAQREKSMQEFRQGTQFLVATNVAARGLDIREISHIINYDTPLDPYVYVHRVGRSARMGADGQAFSIVIPEEEYIIRDIEDSVSVRMRPVYLDESKFDTPAFKNIEHGSRPQRQGDFHQQRFNRNSGQRRSNSYSNKNRHSRSNGNF